MADETPDQTTSRRHLLVAGGGTGGHVFPALAVGERLVERGWQVSWAGRSGGLEEELVSARRVRFHPLASRPLVGRGPLARAAAMTTLVRSALAARRLVRREAIDVVVGTGGYVSAPPVLGARLARRPVLLIEPNARAGVANRWLSRWAQAAAVAFPEAIDDFRCPARLTGVPVRREFFAGAERPLPGEPPRTLLVLGGSQGAEQLNRLLPAALAALPRSLRGGLEVVHQVGPRHVEDARRAYAAHDLGPIEVVLEPFLTDVAAAMHAAHLVISRAGAVTLAEICAARRPAVLIPLTIAGGHQLENARGLEAAGGARVLAEGEVTAGTLSARVGELLADRELRRQMGEALVRLAHPGAADAIADMVVDLAEAA